MYAQQSMIVKMVSDKLILPKLDNEEEVKLLNSIYDAFEIAVVSVIEKI